MERHQGVAMMGGGRRAISKPSARPVKVCAANDNRAQRTVIMLNFPVGLVSYEETAVIDRLLQEMAPAANDNSPCFDSAS